MEGIVNEYLEIKVTDGLRLAKENLEKIGEGEKWKDVRWGLKDGNLCLTLALTPKIDVYWNWEVREWLVKL